MGGKAIAAGLGLLLGFGTSAALWLLASTDDPEPTPLPTTDERTDFVVFLEEDVPDAEVAALETQLQADPRIERLDYMDDEETVEEYRALETAGPTEGS